MVYRIFALAGIIFLFSCSKKEQFPKLISEKVDLNQIHLKEDFQFQKEDSITKTVSSEITNENLNRLIEFQSQYYQKNKIFDIDLFLQEWNKFIGNSGHLHLNSHEKIIWFEINGLLLQITGEAKFAEEMERILQTDLPEYLTGNTKTTDLIAPYIFTKNVDHIYVNLFLPAEITYEHTLHGKVKLWQEFPVNQPDSIYLNFDMEEHRYIELYVRIPGWAEGATVTVKKVKYFAPTGDYCLIAKKWKKGDVVEIYFPKNKQKLNN